MILHLCLICRIIFSLVRFLLYYKKEKTLWFCFSVFFLLILVVASVPFLAFNYFCIVLCTLLPWNFSTILLILLIPAVFYVINKCLTFYNIRLFMFFCLVRLKWMENLKMSANSCLFCKTGFGRKMITLLMLIWSPGN